jgi:hypothetical protein
MEPAQKILVTYGVISLAFGFLLGLPLSSIRMKMAEASRHLVTAHLAAIIQGAMHLGLSVAMGFSTLARASETAAAWLLVAGSALFVLGATANWLQRVGDHFAARSMGWRLLAASAPANLVGIGIVLVGVWRSVN